MNSCKSCECSLDCGCDCHFCEENYCEEHEHQDRETHRECRIYTESDVFAEMERKTHPADLYLGVLEAIDRGNGDPVELARAALRYEKYKLITTQ